jgi:hypothetical protein
MAESYRDRMAKDQVSATAKSRQRRQNCALRSRNQTSYSDLVILVVSLGQLPQLMINDVGNLVAEQVAVELKVRRKEDAHD